MPVIPDQANWTQIQAGMEGAAARARAAKDQARAKGEQVRQGRADLERLKMEHDEAMRELEQWEALLRRKVLRGL